MNRFESKYFNTATLMDEALLLLLEKKDYEYITIKEICQKAGVNRSTFYLHYESINDLLEETIDMINKKFASSFDESHNIFNNNWQQTLKKEDLMLVTTPYLVPYLTFIKENKKIYKLAHTKPELFNSRQTFNKMYNELFEPIMNKFNIPKQEQRYTLEFYTKGILAVIQEWLSNNCQDEIDDIVKIIIKCINYNGENDV